MGLRGTLRNIRENKLAENVAPSALPSISVPKNITQQMLPKRVRAQILPQTPRVQQLPPSLPPQPKVSQVASQNLINAIDMEASKIYDDLDQKYYSTTIPEERYRIMEMQNNVIESAKLKIQNLG